MAGNTSQTVPQLRSRNLGSGRSRRIAGARWPCMETDRRRTAVLRTGSSRSWARDRGGVMKMSTKTMATNREIRILADANSIAQTAAAEFLEAARDAVREKDSF